VQNELESPLTGWMGHAQPFAFAGEYRAAEGMRRFLTGTPSILALAALDAGLDTFRDVDMAAVQAKAEALTGFFLEAVEQACGFNLGSQRDRCRHGGHVIVPHEHGYAVMQALIDRGVIGDFRAPNLMRFGFAPLYNRFEDAWRAATQLAEILGSGAWDRADYRAAGKVT
jgi:kynureninase